MIYSNIKNIIKSVSNKTVSWWKKRPHFFVDPKEITHIIWQKDIPFRETIKDEKLKPIVVNGDWDTKMMKFNDTSVFKSFDQHFVNGVPWTKTDYYYDLKEGHLSGRVESFGGIENFLNRYEQLYDSISNNGFDSRYPIKILISREGNLIRWDGSHRLAISKVLSLSKIPIRVYAVHSDISHIIKLRLFNWVNKPDLK